MNEKRLLSDLGWCIARLTVNSGGHSVLTIISPSAEDGPTAENIHIFGDRGLWHLKKLLDEHFKDAEANDIKGWEGVSEIPF